MKKIKINVTGFVADVSLSAMLYDATVMIGTKSAQKE